MSLKENLVNLIKFNNYLSYSELETACKGKFGKWYKTETATRRLREVTDEKHPSYDPNIKAEGIDEKGFISGWRYVGAKPQYQYFKVEGTDKIIKLLKA